jgi:putative membrane protein
MERRVLLTGLAVLAATPALAQSAPTATSAPAANPPMPAPAPAMKIGAPMSMSDAQKKHVMDTMAAGSLSLALSRIALTKVKHPMLKQFAGFEVAEQETIANILKQMQMPGGIPSGAVIPPTETEVVSNLDATGKTMVERMQAMKAGPAFDRDYVKAQIDGHKLLLDIQEAYLKTPDNADETHVALLAKGMIKEHLALLGDLEKMG